MKLFKQKYYNLESVSRALLNQLKIRVTPVTSDRCIQEHPEYPSVLALSDCLSEWNIENQTYKIEKSDYDPKDLLFPFLAHLKEKGGWFILVNNIDGGKVTYSDGQHQNLVMSEDELLKRWDGIALHAEKKENSGEKEYKQYYLQYFLQKMLPPIALILCLSILGLAIVSHPFSASFLVLCLSKTIGVGISVLLLLQNVNSKNPFILNLCSLGGKNNCNAILKSDAAQLTAWLSWSEVGFFYFAGSLLLLLIHPLSISLMAWLSVLALPYTVYSITYQFRKKNWCMLCCLVQVLLWFEFLVNIGLTTFALSFNIAGLYLIPVAFLTPIVAWSLLKPSLYRSVQLNPLKQQLKKFKYNSDLFRQVLINQPRYVVSDELMPILLGNPQGDTVITMVSNPYCAPCAKAHAFLETWIKIRKDVQIKVIFAPASQDIEIRAKVIRHLTALTLSENKGLAAQALKHWYQQNSQYENWAALYPVPADIQMHAVGESQREWCVMADISVTPTILVNGYKMPNGYRLEDLKYLLN